MTYQPKVYREQGGAGFVVTSGGSINIKAGGKILAAGTQAATIASQTTTGTFSTTICTKLLNVIAALKGVGILATS